MVKMENAVIARYEKLGHKFEMLVDPFLAMELKQGLDIRLDDLLASDEVFKDINKGDRQSEVTVKSTFKTTDPLEIAKIIIREGEVQLTTELRRAMVEKKRKEIINYIASNAYDPKTNSPHPPQRIENAMNEAKVRIDVNKPAEQQAHDVVKQLVSNLPIKFEIREVNVRIPSQYAGKSYSTIKQFGKVIQENWESNGTLNITIELPAGLQEDFELALNSLAKGTVEMKIVGSK